MKWRSVVVGLWLVVVAFTSCLAGAVLDHMWSGRCAEGELHYSTEYALLSQQFGFQMSSPAVAVVNNRTIRAEGLREFAGMTAYCTDTKGVEGIAILYPGAIAEMCSVDAGALECGLWRILCRPTATPSPQEGEDGE